MLIESQTTRRWAGGRSSDAHNVFKKTLCVWILWTSSRQTQSKDFWRQDIIHSNDHNEDDRLILEECSYFFNMVKERPALFILSLSLSLFLTLTQTQSSMAGEGQTPFLTPLATEINHD